MQVKVKLRNAQTMMPRYMTMGAAGMDIEAAHDGVLRSGQWGVIKTGLYLEIPYGYEAQVRPRSGLAAKNGVTVLNAPGTIDSDFRGEVGVILINHGERDWRYLVGERIAQLVFAPVARAELYLVDELYETARGEGAYGSTGL